MLIRMTVGLCGPTMSLEPGDEREFPDDEAVRLIAAGFAVPVARKVVELAIVPPAPETRAVDARQSFQRKGRRR